MKKIIFLVICVISVSVMGGCRSKAPASAFDETAAPLSEDSFNETQQYLIDLAGQLYTADLEFGETVTEHEKYEYFRWYILSDDYKDRLDGWLLDGSWQFPLAEIERIVFTHLDTDTFDPLRAFPVVDDPEKTAWYDPAAQMYKITHLGGYGGAAALEPIGYEINGDIHLVRLGAYDMELYYQEVPELKQIGGYDLTVRIAEDLSDCKIVSGRKY